MKIYYMNFTFLEFSSHIGGIGDFLKKFYWTTVCAIDSNGICVHI